MTPSHAVSVVLDDDLLTFNRVVGVVRRRNLPIEGLSAGPGDAPGVLRLSMLVQTDPAGAERMLRQLEKTHGVRQAAVYPAAEAVAREVALIKVRVPSQDGAALRAAVSRCGATVVEESAGAVIVEIGGDREATRGLIEALQKFGIIEVARSGAVTLRGASPAGATTHPSEAVL